MSTDFGWLWIVLIFIFFALLIWLLGRRKEPSPPNMAHPTAPEADRPNEFPQETETLQSISSQLQDPVSVEPDNLQDLVNPCSWQQQAALAAEGRWVELKDSQTAFKGSK
jgi:hypothetical protein